MSDIEGQVITETIAVHGLLTGVSVGTWQAAYMLNAVEFEHIKNGKPITFNCAISILLTTVGFGLNLLAKFTSQLFNYPQEIYIGEYIALGAGVIISIILYITGSVMQNDRKSTMKKIQNHFKSAQTHCQVVNRDNQ